MRGWYAFDEGGDSGPGGWSHARTTWNPAVAMPHGWAIAELWLLLRDSLLFEDGGRLIILGGVPPEWLAGRERVSVTDMPTWFGPCSFEYEPAPKGAALTLSGSAAPPDGFVLRLPPTLGAIITVDGKTVDSPARGDYLLPAGTKRADIVIEHP